MLSRPWLALCFCVLAAAIPSVAQAQSQPCPTPPTISIASQARSATVGSTDDVAALTVLSGLTVKVSGAPATATQFTLTVDGTPLGSANLAAGIGVDLSSSIFHTAAISFLGPGGTVLCDRPIRIVSLIGWSDATAAGNLSAPNGTATFTFNDPPHGATVNLRLSATLAGVSASITGDLGPTTGPHLHLSAGGAFPDDLTFHGSFIDAAGRDVITSSTIGRTATFALDKSCGGTLPAVKRTDAGGTAGTVSGATIALKNLTLTCGGSFAIGGDVELKFSLLRDFGTIIAARFDALLDGSTPRYQITASPAGTLTLTDNAGIDVSGLDFKDGHWVLAGNLKFSKLSNARSSASAISLDDAGFALQGDPPVVALGNLGVEVQSFSCARTGQPAGAGLRCAGSLGLRLPGFTSAQDNALVAAFDGSSVNAKLGKRTPMKIGPASFEFAPNTTLSVQNGDATVLGSGIISIDSVGVSLSLTNFVLAHTTAGTRIEAAFSGGTGVTNGLFTINNVRGTIKSAATSVDTPPTVHVDADASIALSTSDEAAASLKATARGIAAEFPLTFGGAAKFSAPAPENVTASGSIFGRRINGGCAATGSTAAKPFLQDLGSGSYQFCVTAHLIPGTAVGTTDLLQADVTLKPNPGSGYRVSHALLAHNDAQPLVARFGGRTLRIRDLAVQYDEDGSSTIGAPSFATTTCASTKLSGSLRIAVEGLINGGKQDTPQEMDSAVGFGNRCMWFQADGIAAVQLVPNVHAIVYHAEFVHGPVVAVLSQSANVPSPPMRTYVMARGDLSYQNYTVAFRRLSYDDLGDRTKAPETKFEVDKGQTALKNIPAIAAFLGAIAARVIIH